MPANTPGTVTMGCVGLPVTMKWNVATGAMTSIVVVNSTGATVSNVTIVRLSDGFQWTPNIPTGTTTITAGQLAGQGISVIGDMAGVVIHCPNG